MGRKRYPPEEAKARILDVAEAALRDGGVDAVRVQAIARELGLSDAAIHHHFDGRQGLLEALLKRSGKRLIERLSAVDASSPHDIADSLAHAYDEGHLSDLALWLYRAGWREPGGSGMLAGLVDSVHQMRERAGIEASREDTARALAWLHFSSALEPAFGDPMLRSVGLKGTKASRRAQREWLVSLIRAHLFGD